MDIEKIRNQSKSHPDSPALYRLLGEAYFNKGKIDDAKRAFNKLIELSPFDSSAYNLLGICYYEQNLLTRAVEEYQKALNIKEHSTYYNNLGVVYAEVRKIEDAIDAFNKALELNKETSIIYSNLGVVYNMVGNTKEAEKLFQQALKLEGGSLVAHYCLGAEYESREEMKIDRQVKIVSLLALCTPFGIKLKDYTRSYNSRIEDMDDRTITLAAPLFRGTVVPLREGMNIIVGIPKEDALYGFETQIIGRKGGTLPVLIVRKGEKIKRIQRRKYVRIDTVLPLIKVKDKKFPLADIREKNISGGGLLLVSKKRINPGTILELELDLLDKKINVEGEVIRVMPSLERDEYEIGVSFINLNEKDRDKIIKYVYQRQIDMRKKGF